MTDAFCIICGTNDHARVLYPATIKEDEETSQIFSARRLPDRLHPEMLRCMSCGLVYPRRFPDPGTLQNLYEGSTYLYADLSPYITTSYMRYVRKALGRFKVPLAALKAVDLGCGDGFMVKVFADLGLDAWGIEPSHDAVANAHSSLRSKIIRGLATLETLPAGSYDFLTCFQMLDHMPYPAEFVKLCFDALKPGGTVLFINHDISSLPAKILGQHCPMIDVVHTYLHTPGTMRTLFERTGFTDVDVFPVRSDYPLWYWLHMFPFGRSMKVRMIKGLRKMGIGNVIVPLRAGNVGLIARKSE